MMHRSQPTPQYPDVGPITAASLLKQAARQVVEARKTGPKAQSNQGTQPPDAPRDQHGRRSVPRLKRR